jgi:hypothetical protein
MEELREQALSHGGVVLSHLGNHEWMNAIGPSLRSFPPLCIVLNIPHRRLEVGISFVVAITERIDLFWKDTSIRPK